MNKAGNIGILLAGIGFLVWGLGSAVDSYIILVDYQWEQTFLQEDWNRTQEMLNKQ